ncbi:TetR family transcriptional regulator [uncultured Cohaesibacter sp.]|uniref:TetR family transcriptional regulator n=1 Tax=uncultured Cohaesibacter sp. TaxID=1002546 RepID=UPI00292DEFBB|nr:TetR family transcriptional regulator [uncultured Cohaesibacter sp.]
MARKTKADKEKTYQALIESAAVLFHSQGYKATTLNEIAEKAGMTRGAFYGHFSGKTEVLKAIWNEQAIPEFRQIKEALEDLPPPNPAIEFRRQIDNLCELFSENSKVGRALFILMHNIEMSEREVELIEFLIGQHKMYESVFLKSFTRLHEAGQLKDGMEPKIAAMGFLCILFGMINKALLPFLEFDFNRDGQPVFAHYLDSVLND